MPKAIVPTVIINFADHGLALNGRDVVPYTTHAARYWPEAFAHPDSSTKPGVFLSQYISSGKSATVGRGALSHKYVREMLALEPRAREAIKAASCTPA